MQKKNEICSIVEDKGKFIAGYFDITDSVNLIKQATEKRVLEGVLKAIPEIKLFHMVKPFNKNAIVVGDLKTNEWNQWIIQPEDLEKWLEQKLEMRK